jgi:outer membrane immunogenic protein
MTKSGTGSIRALAAAAMLTAIGVPALAADIPAAGPVPEPYIQPVATSWSGFYAGINGGWNWGNSDWTVATPGHDIDGGLIGLHAGYNFQWNSVVYGIEADIDFADIDGASPCGGTICTTTINTLGSIRGRLGYAWENTQLYGTGGLALAGADFTAPAFTDSTTLTGGVIGGGLEYRFSESLSARAEALYYIFADKNIGGGLDNVDVDATTVRAGVSYHFN